MRRNPVLVLAAATAMALAAASATTAAAATCTPGAKWTVFQAGNLVLCADGGVHPRALPKKKFAAAKVRVRGQISTKDGSHPPAFREATIDFDRNGKIVTTGLPVCRGNQLEARDAKSAKRVCGKSEVGSGNGRIQISFPEQRPIPVKAPITVFNGGTKGGKTTLYIHTFITVPVPSAVVTTVTIKNIKKGRYGLRTVSKVPKIANGAGSVLEFDIRFGRTYAYKGKKRSYISARCTDGRFFAKVINSTFVSEAFPPRNTTNLKGTVLRSCKSKG